MMKRLSLLTFITVLLFSCSQEPQYKITGTVEGVQNGTALLQQYESGNMNTIDSVAIENGSFEFTGSVDFPELYYITLADSLPPIDLFVENSDITLSIDIAQPQQPVVKGAKSNDTYYTFKQKMAEFEMQQKEMRDVYMEARMNEDMEKIKEIEEDFSKVYESQIAYINEFVAENDSCVVGPFIASRYLVSGMDANELDSLVQRFVPHLEGSSYVKGMQDRLAVLKKVAVGQDYIDFTMKDTSGNPVSLSDYVGDGYVMIDFWAAWCNPCRRENPNLVANYAKYHDKGFEIFGVSFDKKKEAWVKAIHDDGITWPQVSDLQYWDNAAGKLYGVRSIPHSVLIGPDGKIVAKNLRGEQLGEKLEELLGDK